MTREEILKILDSYFAKTQRKITDYTLYCDEVIAKQSAEFKAVVDELSKALDRVISVEE